MRRIEGPQRYVGVNIPLAAYQALDAQAKREDISRSALVRRAVRLMLEGKDNGAPVAPHERDQKARPMA